MKKQEDYKSRTWFRLDNAAKLYPAIETSRWSSLYRMSFLFHEPIDPAALQQAVEDILPRFPAFAVRLKRGFFWYYFEENPKPFVVKADEGHPCMPMKRSENNGYLFRVLYDEYRLSVEIFHALCDGTGGIIFIKTLAAQYLRRMGYTIPATHGILTLDETPDPEETEDAFSRLPLNGIKASRKETTSYHLPATKEPPHTLGIISGRVPIDLLLEKARSYGVTITEYVAAAMVYTIYQTQQKSRRDKNLPVKISVPVNMRKYFKTKTLRNFSFFINPGIDPKYGTYTFSEVLEEIHGFMRYQLNAKFLLAGIATNVSSERNPLIRIFPLFIKNLVINGVFRWVGDKGIATTFTNLGNIALPPEMATHIKTYEVLLGPAATPRSNCGGASYGGEMGFFFTRNIRETTLEREFFRFLVEEGLPVTVESNQE